ncbi:MAG TPA: response regulator transcription factor [Candidatus Eisenbacteria bacterium]|nr:response regulator transcription factor [Candidatus Eisenbacteria bacterium]
MSAGPRPESPPRVLVVDDDRRVLELLDVALTSQGFRVLPAGDGDEALLRAHQDRPDLVVLDLRLPKKSGLDVVEGLRRDPQDPDVPILVVSALPEPDSRLEAFRRGADDYLAKPFSPRELVARLRRLLSRADEARSLRRRTHELERSLAAAREEAARAVREAGRQGRLRDLVHAAGRELHAELDLDRLATRTLALLEARLHAGWLALLLPGDEGALSATAARGEGLDRAWALELAPHGMLSSVLVPLGRPTLRAELERFPELKEPLAPFVAAGVALFVPLGSAGVLEAVVIADERRDGRGYDPEQLAGAAELAQVAAGAIATARRVQSQGRRVIAGCAQGLPGSPADVARLLDHAARALLVPAGDRWLIAAGLAAVDDGFVPKLAQEAPGDPSGLTSRLLGWLEEGARGQTPARLLALGLVIGRARALGLPLAEAVQRATRERPADDAIAQAVADAARELESPRAASR